MEVLMTAERPRLTFEMLQAGIKGGVLAVRASKQFFGEDNFTSFREAGRRGEGISELDRLRVDRQIYGQVGERFGVKPDQREKFWKDALWDSNATIDYARKILFPDQERAASLITDITREWFEGRPSQILERLTKPSRVVGPVYRFEQFRQIGLALPCAEVVGEDENGLSQKARNYIGDQFYESGFFQGKQGEPENYHIYSYHEPRTNKLVGISREYPDSRFREGLWVKSLDFPVRKVAVRNEAGEIQTIVPTIYDPREKKTESAVIKALQRSLKAGKPQSNGVLIETGPYTEDRVGVRFVTMEGGDLTRDKVTAEVEKFFWGIEGVREVRPDDDVNLENGNPQRVRFNRRQIYIEGLKKPLEVIVQSVEDFISYLYEVGRFNPKLGMHDGSAWDLYKQMITDQVAPYIWPHPLYGIDLRDAKKATSYQYAWRLRTKGRIMPLPYEEEI